MDTNKLEIYKRLTDSFNKGTFKDFLPYLAPEVIRTSMWYDDVVGLDAVIDYYTYKEFEMQKNFHSHASLARLSYIDNKPSTFSSPIHADIASDAQVISPMTKQRLNAMLWYPEDEAAILLKTDIFSIADVLVRLSFNADGLIKEVNLSDPELYTFEEIVDEDVMNGTQLSETAIDYVENYYKDQGYAIERVPFELDLFPHLHIRKEDEYHQIIVLTDHYPFYGTVNQDIPEFFALRSFNAKLSIKLLHMQVEGLGEFKHYIRPNDPTLCHIKVIKDAYIPYNNAKEQA